MAEIKPEMLDKFNADEAYEAYVEAVGLPPKVTRGAEEVAAIREERKQKQQAAEQAAMAEQMVGTAKEASETEINEGNLAGQLMGAAGGDGNSASGGGGGADGS